MKKTALFSTILFLGVSVTAHAANESIHLNDSEAQPRESLTIQLDKLANGVSYHLSCIVRSDHYTGKGKDDIQVVTRGVGQLLVNRHDTAENNGVVTINAPLNSFIGHDVRQDSMIKVRNLDRFDTIFVERCVATPAEDKQTST